MCMYVCTRAYAYTRGGGGQDESNATGVPKTSALEFRQEACVHEQLYIIYTHYMCAICIYIYISRDRESTQLPTLALGTKTLAAPACQRDASFSGAGAGARAPR